MFSRLVAREVGWQKLDGDVAIQPGVGGLVHHAHPAGAKLRDRVTEVLKRQAATIRQLMEPGAARLGERS